jgi:glycosyltransferase involved in cell wall biosynthesis
MDTMNKTRVLIYALLYYPRFVSGAEVAIKEITDRLGDDFEFDMVTLRMDENLPKVEKIGNITIYRVGWSGFVNDKNEFSFWLNLNKYVLPVLSFWKGFLLHRKHNYKVVWSVLASYQAFGALFLKKLFPHIKFLLTLQEGDSPEYIRSKAKPVWPLFKAVFKNADGVQVISRYLGDLAKEFGARVEPVVVPNAVDCKFWEESWSEEKVGVWKEKLQKKDGDILLFSSSRLVTKNAIKDVIDALHALPAHIKLVVAGNGNLREELIRQIKSLNLESRVTLLGFVDHKELPSLSRACDIFIRPSLSEGFGNSFVEAMVVGLPVIATPVGGIVDFLVDKKTGFMCKPNDPKSIIEAIEFILKNKDVVELVKENAYKMVKEKYDWGVVARQMRDIFGKLNFLLK